MLLPELRQGIQTPNARTRHTALIFLWFPIDFIGFTHGAKLITREFMSIALCSYGQRHKSRTSNKPEQKGVVRFPATEKQCLV
jgi:hypothetical protein